jgi:DNA polymerase-3 subunit gamma/tau
MLSPGAFNALLKILEEPPSHVKFIFATTEPNKVIATVQSRCQRFDFSNINPNLIADQLKSILKQEKIKCEDDLILPLAKMANGSMRDGLSLLDRLISTGEEPLTTKLLEEFLGCPNSERIYNLVAKIGDSDAAETLAAVEDLITAGQGEVQIVDSLIDYMRDLMVVKSAGSECEILVLTAEQRRRVAELAEKFDVAALVYNITALERLRWSLKNTDTPRALLDASMLRFALSEHFLNVDELLSQIKGGPVKKKVIRHNPATHIERQTASPVSSETQDTRQEIRDTSITQDDKSEPIINEQEEAKPPTNRIKARGRRRNEIINDPAVKTVLMGLDATITGIEEKPAG